MIRLLCLLLLAFAGPTGAATALPPDSVYQLAEPFADQDGRPFTLAQRRGQPQLVAMFYTSCKYICPLIVDSGLGIEDFIERYVPHDDVFLLNDEQLLDLARTAGVDVDAFFKFIERKSSRFDHFEIVEQFVHFAVE